jgi:hypothetical protein
MILGNSKPATQQSQAENSTNPTTTNTSTTPVVNSTSTSGLLGVWVSSTPKKGMEGSGKVTLNGTDYQIGFTGDINLTVKKVENNTGTGTITFSNLCLAVNTKPAECLKTYSQPAVVQITGDTIKYTGPTVLGASVSLTGTYANDAMNGTFVRTSSSGKIDGTFNLVREKN